MTDSNSPQPPQRSKAFASVLCFFLGLALVFWTTKAQIQQQFAKRLGSTVWYPIVKFFEQTESKQRSALLHQLKVLSKAHKNQKISESQLYNVSMHLSKRLFAKMIRIAAIYHKQYARNCQLSPAEKASAKLQFWRFIQGTVDGKFKRRDIRPIYERMRAYGEIDNPATLSAQKAMQFVNQLKTLNDNHSAVAPKSEPDLSQIIEAVIKQGLDGVPPRIEPLRSLNHETSDQGKRP